jgi:hypothetical protein
MHVTYHCECGVPAKEIVPVIPDVLIQQMPSLTSCCGTSIMDLHMKSVILRIHIFSGMTPRCSEYVYGLFVQHVFHEGTSTQNSVLVHNSCYAVLNHTCLWGCKWSVLLPQSGKMHVGGTETGLFCMISKLIQQYQSNKVMFLYYLVLGVRSGAVGWGTVLQTRRSWFDSEWCQWNFSFT